MRLKRVLSLKTTGEDVTFLQTKLKEHGFYNTRVDGFFGQNTLVAVSNFQRAIGVKVDGMVGPQTWSQLITFNGPTVPNFVMPSSNKDISNSVSHVSENGLKIYDELLPDDEYYKKETQKNTIFLHHTAGGSRPDWTIGGWDKDYQKDKNGNMVPLKVGTSYVIGRRSSSNIENIWDGKVLRAFDDRYWAYHLGVSTNNSEMLNSRSIGIEICNYGQLKLGKDGRFYNWVNKPIKDEDVVELSEPFRGYKHWERYTDLQLDSTRKLILYLEKKWNMQIERGVYNLEWFDYNTKWSSLGGLRTHTQVRKDKFDIFPQLEMIQMLNSL